MSRGEALLIDQAGASGPVNVLARRAMAAVGFELGNVAAATEEHAGARLGDVDPDCPEQWADKRLVTLEELVNLGNAPVVLSGLHAEPAAKYEPRFAKDRFVPSNSSANRGKDGVPQVNAFVNPDHMDELYKKVAPNGGRLIGIVTGGNCVDGIIAVAAAPIYREIGFKAMSIDTNQGWSGAGYTEVPQDQGEFPEITGDEWKKVMTELNFFLGESIDQPADIRLSGSVSRGPWLQGHRAAIRTKLAKETSKQEIEHIWRHFRAPKALDAVKAELRALNLAGGGEKWPRRHEHIKPVKLEHGDLLRDYTDPKQLISIQPMRVSAHVQGIDQGNPAWIDFEVAGDNLMMGAVGVNLLNVLYARAMGYL